MFVDGFWLDCYNIVNSYPAIYHEETLHREFIEGIRYILIIANMLLCSKNRQQQTQNFRLGKHLCWLHFHQGRGLELVSVSKKKVLIFI